MEMLTKIKNKIVEAKNKTVKFCSDHEDQIKKGAIVVGSFVIGYAIYKIAGKSTLDDPNIQVSVRSGDYNRDIDEDVFTSLAPEIAECILDDSSDEDLIERYYDVDFPKDGDFKNGSWKGRKYVKVLVQDAWNPEEVSE